MRLGREVIHTVNEPFFHDPPDGHAIFLSFFLDQSFGSSIFLAFAFNRAALIMGAGGFGANGSCHPRAYPSGVWLHLSNPPEQSVYSGGFRRGGERSLV